MPFSESLTVRILGDSSGLRREINEVLRQIGSLHDRLSGITSGSDRLGRSLSGLSGAINPLRQVSQWLTRISQQVQALSRTSVSLNVQPALQALQQLTAAIQAAAAMLSRLSIGPGQPVAPQPTSAGGRVSRMAAGGLVTGPPGLDQVSTMLTAGEFVLNRSAVERLGLSLLHDLNSAPFRTLEPMMITGPATAGQERASGRSSTSTNPVSFTNQPAAPRPELSVQVSTLQPAPMSRTESSTTNNHFGGITIQVRETADVNSLIRDLRTQGIQLRNRRG